jgi:hypothetical protein
VTLSNCHEVILHKEKKGGKKLTIGLVRY